MITEAENVADYVPSFYYLFTLLPIFLVITTPTVAGSIVTATGIGSSSNLLQNQYIIYRVHQIDMPYGHFGSRSSTFNLEALTPDQLLSDIFIRKCALFKWRDLFRKNFHDIFIKKILQESLVAAVLIIYDDDIININKPLTMDELNKWQNIEKRLMTNETLLPIYFIQENNDINRLYEELMESSSSSAENNSNKQRESSLGSKTSAAEMILQKIFFDSYQFVVNGPPITVINNPIVTNFQTKLIGAGIEDQIPTYVIVSHYDSYSIIPALTNGADSNASGVIIFLELMRLFSKLYSNIKTRPKANLVFLLSGGGKLNYFGTKKWLDDNFDSSRSSNGDSSLDNIQFAFCLESLADTMNENSLFMYVSKPPKSGTQASFWNNLQEISSDYPQINTTLIHKKINLAEDYLYWEHERFSLKRISAFTLTSLSTSKIIQRRTMIDAIQQNDEQQRLNHIENYINIIGESLARQLYGPIKENLLSGEYSVSRQFIQSISKQLHNVPRTQNLLFTTQKDAQNYQLPPLLKTIQMMMKKYSDGNVRTLHYKVDSKNPEFVFYEPVETRLFIYKTKPAIFDLFHNDDRRYLSVCLFSCHQVLQSFNFIDKDFDNGNNNIDG
ncbi:hypothetical protein DERF_011573 [Dermatophagoides farinae]|uniref:BOS complex subunit NCLN n=1 Tax=Dermatophagoides farinae TaxID=6954 RepID=A0A922HV57_DERFA|nr:hypothetical protein DERF_011573 [Dermatophagoides farinae]